MTSLVDPTVVVSVLARVLFVGAALVFHGYALRQRRPALRLLLSVAAAGIALAALLSANSWIERSALALFGAAFAPMLLGLVVVREDQVGVVIKKFARTTLPAGEFIALNGEAGY